MSSLSLKVNDFCFDEDKGLFENVDNNFKKLSKLLISDASDQLKRNVLKRDKNVFYKKEKIKIRHARPFFPLFLSFDTSKTTLATKKCPSSIRCWNSNLRPLGDESSPAATRPGKNIVAL